MLFRCLFRGCYPETGLQATMTVYVRMSHTADARCQADVQPYSLQHSIRGPISITGRRIRGPGRADFRRWNNKDSITHWESGYLSRYSDWLRAEQTRGRSSSPCRGTIFLFSTSSRLVLRPMQPPIQWVPSAILPGIKRPGREADHSPTIAEIHSLICLHGVVLT
jgi:hypothetical protein